MYEETLCFLVVLLLFLTGCNLIPSSEYTIDFESNGGTDVSSITTDGKTLKTLPTDPEKDGFLFDGWFFDDETFLVPLNVENLIAQNITANITVYAKWIEESITTFTVTFQTVGGSAIEAIQVNGGDVLPTNLVTTKAGFEFAGWYQEANYTTLWQASNLVEANITLYAKWNALGFTISFEENEGSSVDDITAEFGSAVSEPIDPTKAGYTFAGWYQDAELTSSYVFSTMPAMNITVYAKWNVNQYTISFEENEGSSVSDITADFGSVVNAPVNPTKVGYDFGGWFSDSEFLNAYTFSSMGSSNITLYAKWNVLQFSISFEENGGSTVDNITVDYETAISSPLPSKTGYVFEGWFRDSAFVTVYTFSTMPAENLTLYAKWRIGQFTISFEENEGSSMTDITADFGSAVSAPVAPTKVGYTFGGWFAEASLSNAYTFTSMPGANISVYAKWNINQYTLSFEENEGSSVTDITADFESVVNAPVNPTKVGYTFGGWFVEAGLTTPYVFTSMPAENTTVYAKWNISQYTLSFEENEGSSISDITADFGSAVSAPVAPTKAGYTFGGWFVDAELATPYVFTSMPAENTTVYAKWDLLEFEISYVEQIGAGIQEVFVGNGNTFVLTTDNRLIGFGWLGTTYQTNQDQSATPLDITPMLGLQTGELIVGFAVDINFFVLTSFNRVLAWGTNGYGAMGDGTNVAKKLAVDITSQFALEAEEQITRIRTRYNQSFAITNQGRLFGWGSNNYGQLGNNTQTDQYNPQDLTTFYSLITDEKIIDVAIGQTNTTVLTNIGNVYTCGFGTNGAIGNNTTPMYQLSPVKITSFFPSGTNQIIQIVAGQAYNLALSISGQVYGFGLDSYAKFGGTEIRYYVPTELTSRFPLTEGDRIIELTTYGNTNAAITEQGKALVWGADFYDMLYDGVVEIISVIKDISNNISMPFKTIRFGYSHTVIIGNNRIATHGRNYNGELGRGNFTEDQISKEVDLGLAVENALYQEKFGVNTPISLYEPTRLGFLLVGWYTDSALTNQFVETLMPNHNITLYAKFEKATYTISFEENEGSMVMDIQGEYQDPITQPDDPTKLGFDFGGWFTNIELTTPFEFSAMPGENITLYAKWLIKQYTIHFDTNEGSAVENILANYDSGIVPPPAPTKVGHSFGGWYTDKTYATSFVFNTMPAENITLYAKWDVNQYTIFFEENGGSEVVDVGYLYQVKISAPLAPTRDGYTFAGWFTDPELTLGYTFTTMPAMNFTLYAKWVEGNPETMIATQFNKADGTLVEVVGVVYAKNDSFNNGYWIWDATGRLYVNGSHQELLLGDQVSLNGTIRIENGVRYLDNLTSVVVDLQQQGLPIEEVIAVDVVRSWASSNQNFGRLVQSEGILMEEDGFYYIQNSAPDGWMSITSISVGDQISLLQGLKTKMVNLTYVLTMDGFGFAAMLVEVEEIAMTNQEKADYIEELAILNLSRTYAPQEEFVIPEADPYGWTSISYTIDGADEAYFDIVSKRFKDTELEVQIIFHITLTIGLDEFGFDLPIILKPKTITPISEFNTGITNQLYTLKGIVVADSEIFAVLKDDTGFAFFFNSRGLNVGDEVIISAKRMLYNNMSFIDSEFVLEEKISEGNNLNLVPEVRTLDSIDALDYMDPSVYGDFVEIRGNLMTSSYDYHEFYSLLGLTSMVPVYPFGHSSFETLINYEYYEIVLRGFLFDNGDGKVGLFFDGSRGDLALPDYTDQELVNAIKRMAELRFDGVEFTSLDEFSIPSYDQYLGGSIEYEMEPTTAALYDEQTKSFRLAEEKTPITIVFTITKGLASATYTYHGYLNPLPTMGLSELQAMYNYDRVYVQGVIVYRHPEYAYLLGIDGKLLFIDIDQLDAYVGDEVILCVSKRTNYNGYEIYVARDELREPIVQILARNQEFINPLTSSSIAELVSKDPTTFETFTQRVEVEGVIDYRTSQELVVKLADQLIRIDPVDLHSFYELELFVGKRVKVIGYISEYDSYYNMFTMRFTGLESDVTELIYEPLEQIALVKAELIARLDLPTFRSGDSIGIIYTYPGFPDLAISYEVLGDNAGLVDVASGMIGVVTQFETVLMNITIDGDGVSETFQVGIHIDYQEIVLSTIAEALLASSSVTVQGVVQAMTQKTNGALALIKDTTGLLYVFIQSTYYSSTLLGKNIQVTGMVQADHNRLELVTDGVTILSTQSVNPDFAELSVGEVAAMDQANLANYGMGIVVTGVVKQNSSTLFIEADGVKIAISSFSNVYWNLSSYVGLTVQIRGFFIGAHPLLETMENTILVDAYSYGGMPSFQVVGYDEAAKIAYMKERFISRLQANNPPLWPNDMYWLTKASMPFMDVQLSYQILTNSEYVQLVIQAPYGDDYLLIKLAPQDVDVEIEVTFTCGEVNDTLTFTIHLEGFEVGQLSDLFVDDGLTTQIALEATVIHRGWGYFYFLIEDQVYYIENLYEWYSPGDQVYLIGRKDSVDGVADFTYHLRIIGNTYQEVALTAMTTTIADIYSAVDLSLYKQNLLQVEGYIEYDSELDLYYLEKDGEVIYLRADNGTGLLEQYKYCYVQANILFSGKTIRYDYYIADFMNSSSDIILPEYTSAERFTIINRFLDENFTDVVLQSGDYIDNLYTYHGGTNAQISYELVDPLDADYFDLDNEVALLVDAVETVDILATCTYSSEVIGTKTITITIQPRLVSTIEEVNFAANHQVVVVEGVVEMVVSNEYWLVGDPSGQILVNTDWFVEKGLELAVVGDVVKILAVKQTLDNIGIVPILEIGIDFEKIGTSTVDFVPSTIYMEELIDWDYTNPNTIVQEIKFAGVVVNRDYDHVLMSYDYDMNYYMTMIAADEAVLFDELQPLEGEMIIASGYLIGLEHLDGYFNWMMIIVDYTIPV